MLDWGFLGPIGLCKQGQITFSDARRGRVCFAVFRQVYRGAGGPCEGQLMLPGHGASVGSLLALTHGPG